MSLFFFFNDTATTEIYTLSLHDALPISTDFLVAPGKSSHFIFATEDGTISGWNGGPNAVLVVDNSNNGSADGAVYKGATSREINGNKFLYVTNFRSARVEVYDTNFKRLRLGEEAFNAEKIPLRFAPFNIP